MLIAERFYESIAPISHREDEEHWESHGTGFLYKSERIRSGQILNRLFLVTNKHNLQSDDGRDVPWAYVSFNQSKDQHKAAYFDINFFDGDFKTFWTSRKGIDIAVMDVNGSQLVNENLVYNYFQSDMHCWTLKEMHIKKCFEGESVFVIGYPADVDEGLKNFPVVRSGMIARIQDAYKAHAPSFLIEALITKGNSGSPVILRPSLTSIDSTIGPSQSRLIGVVSDYFKTPLPRASNRPVGHSGLCTVWTVDTIEALIDDHVVRFPNR